jgi:hypothetical protein
MGYIHHVLPCKDCPTHGIWNFAKQLSLEIQKNNGVTCSFANWYHSDQPVTLISFDRRGIFDTIEKLKAESNTGYSPAVLLHFDYGSYGWYDLPLWLPIFILFLKYKFNNLKFAIFVHEIYPITPRRLRERFLLKLSQRITWLFFNQADVLFCSNSTVEKILNSRKKNTQPCLYRPVFSNIGEAEGPQTKLSKNSSDWVIFGSAGNLPKYIYSFRNQLDGFPEFLKPSHVTILGGGNADEVIHAINNLREKNVAVLYIPSASAEKCSEIFSKSKYCYINYFDEKKAINPELLFKSGVFAAANAHGVITVIPSSGFGNFSSSSSHPGVIWKDGFSWQEPKDNSLSTESILHWYHIHSSLKGMAKLIFSHL